MKGEEEKGNKEKEDKQQEVSVPSVHRLIFGVNFIVI